MTHFGHLYLESLDLHTLQIPFILDAIVHMYLIPETNYLKRMILFKIKYENFKAVFNQIKHKFYKQMELHISYMLKNGQDKFSNKYFNNNV